MEELILDEPGEFDHARWLAGFWHRVGASLMDGLIVWFVSSVISIFIQIAFFDDFPENWFVFSFLFVNVVYHTLMESSRRGATFGKSSLGIYVAKANGEKLSVWSAFIRSFSRLFSFAILLIGVIMVEFDKSGQGMHDKIAKSFVFLRKHNNPNV